MDRAAALDRVRKLIALAGSDREEEARTAALQACRLIREHRLVVALEAPRPPAPPPRPARPSFPDGRHEVMLVVEKTDVAAEGTTHGSVVLDLFASDGRYITRMRAIYRYPSERLLRWWGDRLGRPFPSHTTRALVDAWAQSLVGKPTRAVITVNGGGHCPNLTPDAGGPGTPLAARCPHGHPPRAEGVATGAADERHPPVL